MLNSIWSYDAPYIKPFDLQHFIYIFIMAASLALLLFYRRKVKANREKLSRIILIVSILQQVLLYSWYPLEVGLSLSDSLPLHICRISSLLCVYFLITKNKKVLEIEFFFGLYAYGSFLYPQRIYSVYHLMGLSFLISHTVTILLPYFAYIAYDWRPDFKAVLRSYFFFIIYFVFVYFLNPTIDGNYFYLKYRPFFRNWPDMVYVPSIFALTFCGYTAAYGIVRFISRPTVVRRKEDINI